MTDRQVRVWLWIGAWGPALSAYVKFRASRRNKTALGRSPSLSPGPGLNLILIGEREAGKSAVGNAILGRKAFDEVGVRTRVSVRQESVVRGRRVLVVDTPGWEWFNLSGSRASSDHVRKEIVASMKLCHPGAHALLLVVPLSFSFSGRERCVVEEHVELFGPQAWSHTMILFTVKNAKQLLSSSLQDEVEDNAELVKVVEKCGGRYHALYSHASSGEDLVAKLLAKIQEMVSANGEVLLSEEVLRLAREREEEEKRREEQEMNQREEKMKREREAHRMKEMEERVDSEDDEEEEMPERFEVQDLSETSSVIQDLLVCCKTQ